VVFLKIEEHVQHFPWLTPNMEDHYIVTYKEENLMHLDIDTSIKNQTVVSGLTHASPIALATANITAIATPAGTTITTPGSESFSTSKKGGIPERSTKSMTEEMKSMVVDAMDECTIHIANVKSMAMYKTHKCGKTGRVRRGTFDKVIEKVCDKYNIERSEIHMGIDLIRNKVGRKLKLKHCGTESPMAGTEGHLLAAILRSATLHPPVSCAKGLELANSLIEGTPPHIYLMAWKKAHLKNGPEDESFGIHFFHRNADLISAKKAARFDSKRDDWCHLDNFEDMYDDVYERLWEACIAEKLDEAVWRDKYNNIVLTHAEAYGRNMYLVMVDKIGEHISQKGDDNAGGQMFMMMNGMREQVRISFKDNYFTAIGFTAVNAYPTMCAIIIAA
jgi:hypothetical protein